MKINFFIKFLMSKRKHKRNKQYLMNKDINPFYLCDKNKFVIKQENEGKYSIYYIDTDIKICILTYQDKDDEYCKNSIIETLNYLQREI